jgi:dienelactone hydrolase
VRPVLPSLPLFLSLFALLIPAAASLRAQLAPAPAVPRAAEAAVNWAAPELRALPAAARAPEHDRPGVEAWFIESVPFEGHPTRVFAFLGLPGPTDPGPSPRRPAMVLAHGGGGTAFAEWVRHWNRRGYVALALDHGGCIPGPLVDGKEQTGGRGKIRHPDGGPAEGGASFSAAAKPPGDQWPYHAVAAVMRAHSFLAARADVDPARIGLTGISWGGVLTGLVAGIDSRFRVFVPVYGCGFLEESDVFRPQLAARDGPRWRALWDPSHTLPHAERPLLWVNGTNDRFFHPAMWQRSTELPRGPVTRLLIPRMPHNHPDGWKPAEIGVFVDSVLRDGPPLPRLGPISRRESELTVTCQSPVPLTRAALHFTVATADVPASQHVWQEAPARVETSTALTATLPPEATAYFFSVTDERGCTVTSSVSFTPR